MIIGRLRTQMCRWVFSLRREKTLTEAALLSVLDYRDILFMQTSWSSCILFICSDLLQLIMLMLTLWPSAAEAPHSLSVGSNFINTAHLGHISSELHLFISSYCVFTSELLFMWLLFNTLKWQNMNLMISENSFFSHHAAAAWNNAKQSKVRHFLNIKSHFISPPAFLVWLDHLF